jgi:hypothetical protein
MRCKMVVMRPVLLRAQIETFVFTIYSVCLAQQLWILSPQYSWGQTVPHPDHQSEDEDSPPDPLAVS